MPTSQTGFSIINSQFSIPTQTTPLIGRETELVEMGAMLENPACRLITIVGTGGIGKTRLALAAAAEQADVFTYGAAFVPLAAISSAQFLAPAILGALDVEPQGQRDRREQLLDYLREKELLLVLDNVEQFLVPDKSESEGLTDLLAAILERAPGVTLLVTSRERLALPGEWMFDLPGLNYPPRELLNGIDAYSAVRLFMQRAGQVRRQFALAEGEARAVARICRLVEGLPLAIELAAAALRTRSCAAIARAIERNVAALAIELRAVPERHRSIWATFEHSWRLLSDEERQVFPRLSVFRGGFEEDAAAQVAQASPHLLASLVDKSLLRWDGVERYDMQELVRQYAGEKLQQASQADAMRRIHALYFLAFAETAEPNLTSSARGQWLKQLDQEHDNLRAALAWSQETVDAGETSLRLVGALFWFWFFRNYVSEGRSWAEGALTTASTSGPPRAWANALYSAGFLAFVQEDFAAARARLTESVERWQETQDRRGLAWALSNLALVLCNYEDYSVADDLGAESVAILRELEDPWGLACVMYHFGNVAYKRGDYATARPRYEESLAFWRRVADPWGQAMPLYRLGLIACKQGDYVSARRLLEESLALRRQAGHKYHILLSLSGLAEVALGQGNCQQAAACLAQSLALHQELGTNNRIGPLEQFAQVAAIQGRLECAVQLWGAAQAQRDLIGHRPLPGESLGNHHVVAAVRAQLGEEAFAAAWAEGRAMSMEQAIAYALEDSKVDREV
jgi:predicted ATPase